MLRILCYSLCLVALLAVPASATPYDDLIDKLTSNNEGERALAAQLLPRQNVSAVTRLITHVDEEDADVWRAVIRMLENFANQVTMAGREDEQEYVTTQLMTMLEPDRSDRMKEYGLRILPIVVPEGFDVSPIAALLDSDEVFRERARAALLNIGTVEAAQAIVAFLPKADNTFKVALLDALGQMRAVTAKATILEYTQHDDPMLRAAAASALAGHPDASLLPVLNDVREKADAATNRLATDAMIRLAENLVIAGGNWSLAMDAYALILETESDPVMRGAAIAGLGRFGDEDYLPLILDAIMEEPGGYLTGPGFMALEAMKGVAPQHMMLEAYADMPKELQVIMLGMFGRKQSEIFMPVLNEAVNSEDTQIRDTAVKALIASGLPGAVAGLQAYAQATTGDQKDIAVEALHKTALQLRDRGDQAGAGSAYLALYQSTTDSALRQQALEGIMQNPTSDAFGVLINEIGTENLHELSTEMLSGMAGALWNAGRQDEAMNAYTALKSRANTTEGAHALMNLAGNMGNETEISRALGFIRHWNIVGPFPWASANDFSENYINEPDIDLSASYEVNEVTLQWHKVEGGGMQGMVNLAGLFDNATNATAFAYAEIEVAEAMDAVVRIGSDDGFKIWVNGEVAGENNVDRGSDLDQDLVPVSLKSGKNAILMQITQGGGGWNFFARLTGTDGLGLEFN